MLLTGASHPVKRFRLELTVMLFGERTQTFTRLAIAPCSVIDPPHAPLTLRPLRRGLALLCYLKIFRKGLVVLLLVLEPHAHKQHDLSLLLGRQRHRGQHTPGFQQLVSLSL